MWSDFYNKSNDNSSIKEKYFPGNYELLHHYRPKYQSKKPDTTKHFDNRRKMRRCDSNPND